MQEIEERERQLKLKRICRFCMTQEEPLANIHSVENRVQSKVPLPVQILAVTSIEVFTNDTLPSTICVNCRILIDYCYRFKQVCKTSDTKLKQYPLTGIWPEPLEVPKIPSNDSKEQKERAIQTSPQATIKRGGQFTPPSITPLKKPKIEPTGQEKKLLPAEMRLLNKAAPKILNKNVARNKDTVRMREPVVKTDVFGNVEIVTELMDNSNVYIQEEPVSAEPVETNVFPCQYCDRTYPLKQLLDIHMTNHIREREFECEQCPKRFFNKNDLAKHMSVHTGEKPYECIVCHKRFSRSTLLYRHEKVHVDQPRYLCVFCERPFLSRDELNKHTDTHKKKRPFSCDVCGKSFAYKQGVERHQLSHSQDLPYQCEHCTQSFMTPSKLARHLTQHAGKRPYPCKLCPKTFLLSHHLTRHLRSHSNTQYSTYKCLDCAKVFKTRDELIYHSAVHATENLTCPLCKEKFEDLDSVTEHIRQHSMGEQFACDYCDLIFTSADKLEDHCLEDHEEDHRGNEKGIKMEQIEMADIVEESYEQQENEEPLEGDNEEHDIEEDEYIIEELQSSSPKMKQEPQTDKKNKIMILNNQKVNMLKTNPIAVKDDNVEVLAEFEIRKSSRPKREPKTYESMKPGYNEADEDGESEDISGDFSGDDGDVEFFVTDVVDEDSEAVEDDEEEEETVKAPTPPPPKKIVQKVVQVQKKSSPQLPVKNALKNVIKVEAKEDDKKLSTHPKTTLKTQEKITKFIQAVSPQNKSMTSTNIPKTAAENLAVTGRELDSDKNKEIAKVLKNLPKGIAIMKTDSSTKETHQKLISLKVQQPTPTISKVSPASSKKPTESKVSTSTTPKEDSRSPKATQKVIKTPTETKVTKSTSTVAKSPTQSTIKQPITPSVATTSTPKFCEMKIGDRMVKVQKLKMTKDQVDAMKKEGKIEMKDGAIILKNTNKPVTSSQTVAAASKTISPVRKARGKQGEAKE